MADSLQTVYDSKRTGAVLILTDLDVAMTFLAVANTTRSLENRQRNYENARKAYNAVLSFLPRVIFTTAEAETVHEKLEFLRNRLEAAHEASHKSL